MELSLVHVPRWLEEQCERIASVISDNESPHDITPITHCNMNLRRLNYQMTDALARALSQSSRIQAINLTWSLVDTNTCSDRKLIPLAEVLRYHPSLEVVYLSYNRLASAGPLGLALSTNTTLRELHLDHNRLTSDCAIAIAQALLQNTQHTKLAVLCLNSNSIGDEGGVAIASMLKVNNSITTLQLAKNELGVKTAQMLGKSLQHNVTLVELRIDQNPDLPQEDEGQIMYLIRANRAGRYLLRHHHHHQQQQQQSHTNPPLGLWPLVLARLDLDLMYFFLHEAPTITAMQ